VNPFSSLLKDLRVRRGLRQKEVANMLGYEQSYICSEESGKKGLPREAFL
jgi:transcriptional regulator with XRE-family HTH domain